MYVECRNRAIDSTYMYVHMYMRIWFFGSSKERRIAMKVVTWFFSWKKTALLSLA